MEKLLLQYAEKETEDTAEAKYNMIVIDADDGLLYNLSFKGHMGCCNCKGCKDGECDGIRTQCTMETFHALLEEFGTEAQKEKYGSINRDNWKNFI